MINLYDIPTITKFKDCFLYQLLPIYIVSKSPMNNLLSTDCQNFRFTTSFTTPNAIISSVL